MSRLISQSAAWMMHQNCCCCHAVVTPGTGPVGPTFVDLGSADGFALLSKTGITNTGSHLTAIIGDIASSPITAAAMDGVFCTEITGTIFGVDAAYTGSGITTCYTNNATIANNAISDMEAAYTDAAGRTGPTAVDLGGGSIGGMTLTGGLYKWTTSVNIASNLTLSGGASDTWIFQIAGDLSIASGGSVPAGIKVLLVGGASADNVFWQVAGGAGVTLGTYSTFNGTILSQTAVISQTGSVLNGRGFAQSTVTLDESIVTIS